MVDVINFDEKDNLTYKEYLVKDDLTLDNMPAELVEVVKNNSYSPKCASQFKRLEFRAEDVVI